MDSGKTLALIAAMVTIGMQVASQLLLRSQVAHLGGLPPVDVVLRASANPYVWLALAALLLGAGAWFVTLSRLELNQAFPIVALTIPLTAALSTWLFAEPMPLARGFGIALIVVGVVVVART